jgi:hypothetical protein
MADEHWFEQSGRCPSTARSWISPPRVPSGRVLPNSSRSGPVAPKAPDPTPCLRKQRRRPWEQTRQAMPCFERDPLKSARLPRKLPCPRVQPQVRSPPQAGGKAGSARRGRSPTDLRDRPSVHRFGNPPKPSTPESSNTPPKLSTPESSGNPLKPSAPEGSGDPFKPSTPEGSGDPPKPSAPESSGNPPKPSAASSISRYQGGRR